MWLLLPWLDVLVDRPQWRAEYALKLLSLSIGKLSDIRVHRINSEPSKRLRPLILKLVEPDLSTTTRSREVCESETDPIVVVVHSILPPINRDMIPALWTSDPLKIPSTVEELDLV